jgi:UDP-N-acetylglucosamine 2-epimerase (non-hydrolysing)
LTARQFTILLVVGARPNFMKVAPIITAIRKHNETVCGEKRGRKVMEGSVILRHLLVHTGQHYDATMSDQFFRDLGMQNPDINLGVGSGSHAVQTAEVMKRFEQVLLKEQPDAVLVVGDVNSTIACALVASKIRYAGSGQRPLIIHVEAGLRSFDADMPEECNRILTDHLSNVLFVTEPSGRANLLQEGISEDKIFFVGNTMIDTLLAYRDKAQDDDFLREMGLQETSSVPGSTFRVAPYALLTLHRPSNVDTREAFQQILEGISEVCARWPLIFPAHPRTWNRMEEFGLQRYIARNLQAPGSRADFDRTPSSGIWIIPPQGYLRFVCLMKNAALVITDSGGVQEETTCLGVPCVTVRDNTERPVTIDRGTNILAGTTSAGIRQAVARQMEGTRAAAHPEKWDGCAAQRIVSILIERMCTQAARLPLRNIEHDHRSATDQAKRGIENEGARKIPSIA